MKLCLPKIRHSLLWFLIPIEDYIQLSQTLCCDFQSALSCRESQEAWTHRQQVCQQEQSRHCSFYKGMESVAQREAFANSLIHAAYTVRGNIVIDRYFDRIVLSNPGTMLVSMEEYYEGGHSVCRNPIIQKMFVFLGIGEKGGTGADVIAKGWRDNGWSIPTVEEKNNPDRIETYLSLVNHTNIATETSAKTTETTTETLSDTTETPAKTTETTTETIIESIRNNPKITTKEIAAVCGITEDGVSYHIKKLKQMGKIVRVGGSRNGGEWKVVE